jgi:hypothetical protein
VSTLPQQPAAVLIGPNSGLFGSKLPATNSKETNHSASSGKNDVKPSHEEVQPSLLSSQPCFARNGLLDDLRQLLAAA